MNQIIQIFIEDITISQIWIEISADILTIVLVGIVCTAGIIGVIQQCCKCHSNMMSIFPAQSTAAHNWKCSARVMRLEVRFQWHNDNGSKNWHCILWSKTRYPLRFPLFFITYSSGIKKDYQYRIAFILSSLAVCSAAFQGSDYRNGSQPGYCTTDSPSFSQCNDILESLQCWRSRT